MKKLIVAFFAILSLSCSNDSPPIPAASLTITPILIGKGINSGTAVQSNSVISNQTDWQSLMDQLTTENTATFTETNIDFNNFQLIVSIDSTRPNTGYSIDISSVIENPSNITVTINSVNSGSGFSVLCRPFEIVKIPKSTKPVVFL
jgi:hypothetical protein